MLLNLRGSSGSGKSTVVRQLFSRYGARSIYGRLGPCKPEAYRLTGAPCDAFVIGPYLSACGGCDRLGSMEPVLALVDKYAQRGHVIFESLLISSMYGSVGKFLASYRKDAIVAYLTTSQERCRAQLALRQSNGRARGDASFERHYFGTLKIRKRMLNDDIVRVEDLDPDRAVEQIERWLAYDQINIKQIVTA
jgi:hypothetical protein